MIAPKRILDEQESGLSVTLLRAARDYKPRPSAKARVMGAVGLGAGAAVTTTAAKGASVLQLLRGLGAAIGGKAGVGALVLVGAAAVGGISAQMVYTAHIDRPVAAPLVQKVAIAQPAPLPEAPGVAPAPTAAAATVPVPVVTPGPLVRAAPRVDADRSVKPPADTLAQELALLERARDAQRAHDPAQALLLLDQLDRQFPGGHLQQQSQVLRIELLSALGDTARARILAQRFLLEHPSSLLASRVRTLAESFEAP